jgi:prepilin-type N-terminal cleavage/methylation domain-containing protein
MATRCRGRGFTLVELLVVIAIIAILMILLLPALNMVREASKRTACGAKLNQLALACMSYEQQNGAFPRTSDGGGSNGSKAGTTYKAKIGEGQGNQTKPETTAGYSWLVKLLSGLELKSLDQKIIQKSQKYQYAAFDLQQMTDDLPKEDNPSTTYKRHFALTPIPAFICPSYGGVTESEAQEYDKFKVDTNMSGKSTDQKVQITNYVPLSASHIECMGDPVNFRTDTTKAEKPNGAMTPEGVKLKQINNGDGVTNTILLTETKESDYASWYDGTTAFVVAARPKNPGALVPYDQSVTRQQTQGGATGGSYWTAGQLGQSALMIGPPTDHSDDGQMYLESSTYQTLNTSGIQGPVSPDASGKKGWKWGPSSDHAAAVMHVFCDRSVRTLKPDVDKDVYMHLVTIKGGENDSGSVLGE